MLCSVCNGSINENSYTDYWGNHYCDVHNKLSRCYSCHRIICKNITNGGMLYQDGRQMCNLCRQTAVMTAADARPLETQVKKILAAFTLDLRQETIPVRLVGQDEMDRIRPSGYLGLARPDHRLQNGQYIRSMREILVLYGLPAEHFAATLAHEYGHAWIWLTGYPELPKPVDEGLCELFVWIWLKSQHTPEAAYRLKLTEENPDCDYGDGFRIANLHFKKRRLLALLEHVKAHREFPS